MVPQYKLNETIAVRKRVPIHLVDGSDGITAKTAITGSAKIAKNYGTPATSTNAIVEVDATNSPGLYYVELDSTELDTLGWLSVRFKTAATAEYQIVCQVINDDPYASHTGPGLSLPSGSLSKADSSLKKEEMIELAKMVWNVILENNKTAKEVLLTKSEFDPAQDVVMTADDSGVATVQGLQEIKTELGKLSSLEVLESMGDKHNEIMQAMSAQKPFDYTPSLKGLSEALSTLQTALTTFINRPSEAALLKEAVAEFQPKINEVNTAVSALEQTIDLAQDIVPQLQDVQTILTDITEKIDKKLDVEKRFSDMNAQSSNQALADIKKELIELERRLAATVVNSQYDILKNAMR